MPTTRSEVVVAPELFLFAVASVAAVSAPPAEHSYFFEATAQLVTATPQIGEFFTWEIEITHLTHTRPAQLSSDFSVMESGFLISRD